MNNLYFYPKLTDELKDACGLTTGKYVFSYSFQDNSYGLKQKGSSTIKLTDPLEIWKIESEGISFTKAVSIAYPHLLLGSNGIACADASIGICIMWTNKTLTQTGCILPESDIETDTGRICNFNHTFEPGLIKGDLELSVILYLKKKADNILPGDVYVRTKELHFVPDVPRALLLVRQVEHTDVAAVEVLQNMFTDRQHDFVISVNEADMVVIKELPNGDNSSEVKAIAESIEKTLEAELQINCIIGIGTTARHLRELADRYKEAQIAIDVGRVFDSEKTIISYENLGIGRIIYQLPTTLCEMFLNEVFKKNPLETLDEDTLETINKFFENNLNVSETSRKLYVHRNTLVYRLEKIKKLTGLDLREFDHAIVFKVAMMVKQYLDSVNNNGR